MGEVLEITPVTPARWNDLVDLFERRGPRGGRTAPGYCWCTVWRATLARPPQNRAVMERCVADGPPPGLLAYDDGRPVGWISIAPRPAFPRLANSRTFRDVEPDADVFVISCLFVPPTHRKRGVASRLLDAAIDHVRAAGARGIEGSPADPPDFTGTVEQFLGRGFEAVRTVGNRTVVRLDL